MRGRAPDYPGLTDPRTALEPFKATYDQLIQLKRRFHVSAPAYGVLDGVSAALRDAALLLTNDPYYFSGGAHSQSVYKPPAAPPIPGIVRVPLAKPAKIKHPT
jgi:hypothetical protein